MFSGLSKFYKIIILLVAIIASMLIYVTFQVTMNREPQHSSKVEFYGIVVGPYLKDPVQTIYLAENIKFVSYQSFNSRSPAILSTRPMNESDKTECHLITIVNQDNNKRLYLEKDLVRFCEIKK